MSQGGLCWTDFFPDTPADVYAPPPVAVITSALFDIADLPSLVAWTRCCSRTYSSVTLTAKARQRAAILAKQRKALLDLLAARAFKALADDRSTPGALSSWVVPTAPILPIDNSEDLN